MAVAIALGFGRAGADRRDAVSVYLREVNTLQVRNAGALGTANRAYAGLSFGAAGVERQVTELEKAAATISTFRGKVAALTPPPEAARLEQELLRLYALQAELATEVALLRRYLPAFAATEAKLVPAAQNLRRELGTTTGAEQAAAFAAYAARLDAVARKLTTLRPPDVLERARTVEIERLRTLARLARKVRAAVVGGRSKDLQPLLRKLAGTAGSVATANATRAGTIAYNRRLREIGAQRSAVEQERRRLDRELS